MNRFQRLKILFLCTGNSCRSQMAEGFCRFYQSGSIEAFSCGTERHGLNPLAVKVMQESNIDISAHRSKTLDEVGETEFDYVVTVCGHANEACPVFAGKTRLIHRGFDDPPKLAAGCLDENEVLAHYRRVRDEIRDFIMTLPDSLGHL